MDSERLWEREGTRRVKGRISEIDSATLLLELPEFDSEVAISPPPDDWEVGTEVEVLVLIGADGDPSPLAMRRIAPGSPTYSLVEPPEPQKGPAPNAPSPSSRRRLLAWASGVIAVFGAVTLALRQYQPLYVINPARFEAKVEVAGQSTRVAPGSRELVYVPEGTHQVRMRLTNGVERSREIRVSNGFRERYMRNSYFVYVVLGARPLYLEQHLYSREPINTPPLPPVLMAGKEFYAFHNVDYAFTGAPDKIGSTTAAAPTTTLNVIGEVGGLPETFIHESLGVDRPQVQLRAFAEGQLLGGNTSTPMVEAYWDLCMRSGCEEEARKLMASLGLEQATER